MVLMRNLLTCLLAVALLNAPAMAADYEQELLVLINQYRATHQLAALDASPEYDELARTHSQAMLEEQRLSHDGFKERFKAAQSRACVENVGWNHRTPQAQFNGWEKSPGHNKNMLAPQITRVGIARVGGYVTFFACK